MPLKPNFPKRPTPNVSSYLNSFINDLFQQALSHHKNGNLNDAQKIYEKILKVNPGHFDTLHIMAIILAQKKQFIDALMLFESAVAINPNNAEVYNNRGILFYDLKRFDDAIQNYDKAIQLKPNYAEAYNNCGNAFKELKCFDEALLGYDKAIQLKPNYADAYWNKSLLKLLLGEYGEGWKLYEWRKIKDDTKNHYPNYSQPLWLGNDSLEGKIIMVHSEQGFGDSIQFCRYIPMLKALNPRGIIFQVEKSLVSLMASLGEEVQIIEKGKLLPKFDCYCPLLSLPFAFKTTLDNIPAKTQYLYADVAKNKYWRKKLGEKTKPRIGLVWSGSTKQKNDHNRSIPLVKLLPLINTSFEFHSLHKEYRPNDLEILKTYPEITQHQDDLKDLSDTAALIEQMDLIISVCTSVAHLTSALGKKLYILLRVVPDYRWMLDRNHSPWYPSAKLFRQTKIDDWDSVILNVKESLQKQYLA
jgi:Tfp pilus assembly protein PilF